MCPKKDSVGINWLEMTFLPGSASFSSSEPLLPYFFKISSSSFSISSCDLLTLANGIEATCEVS